MATPVRIETIAEGMAMQSDEMCSFLHVPSGRVLTVSEDALIAAESGGDDAVAPEELADAQRIRSAGDEYLALPDRFEIDEYRMMERFANTLNAEEGDAVLNALQGRDAFRHFKDTVHQLGHAKAWYAFRDGCYREVARDWCEANGIAHDSPLVDTT